MWIYEVSHLHQKQLKKKKLAIKTLLLTVYLLVVSISQNGCYPQFLGVDVSPHKVVAWGWVDHGLQLTANTVRLPMAEVSVNDNDIRKKISRVPMYHTKWKRRALYNNINNTCSLIHPPTRARTHTHTHTHTHSLTPTHTCTHTLTHPHTHAHTHTCMQTHQLGDRHGCEKEFGNSPWVNEQACLEGGFKREGMKGAEHLRQTVPNRKASVQLMSMHTVQAFQQPGKQKLI